MGYADELFEMRRNQDELKQIRRNLVDTQKFTFQKQHVTIPRQPDDYSVNDELLKEVASYMDKKKDQLEVDWEYIDEVQRVKNLRRIKLVLDKDKNPSLQLAKLAASRA